MTNVMTNAWEIARDGQDRFGGNLKQYFAESLRIAWAILKGGNKMNRVNGTIQDRVINLPELQGSPKQVEWANKIRQESSGPMMFEVKHEHYKDGMPKRAVTEMIEALQTKESTDAYIKDYPFDKNNLIKSMNSLLDRYDRMIEVATNPSAKFWIDNRGNQEDNYQYKLFAKYVETGIKEF